MNHEIVLKIPSGFQVICKEEEYDILDAGELLCTRKRYKYTSARRCGDKAVLRRHLIKCPFCGEEIPAYEKFMPTAASTGRCHIPREVVEVWASPQCSLFEDENEELALNEVVTPQREYRCHKCGKRSSADKGARTVRIVAEKNKIAVLCNARMKFVVDLMMNHAHQSGRLLFPLTECVEFNPEKGRATLTVFGGDGSPVIIRDITYARQLWKDAETYGAIKDSYLVRRALRQRYEKRFGGSFPMPSWELSPETFLAVTQFTGYPARFYDTVPYEFATGNIERSFVALARRMRSARYLDRIYTASALPAMKSIRERFFTEPGLFFYLYEAEQLWRILEDPNHFRRLLEMPWIYELLSNLRQYPGMCVFLRDYRAVKGKAQLMRKLTGKMAAMLDYAVNYCAMSPAERKREQKTWNRKNTLVRRSINHAIPVQTGSSSLPDCTVDGYTFTWLRTKYEYVQAGHALCNCLTDWNSRRNPVIVVKKGDRFLAAIEMRDRSVVQARAIRNTPVEHDEQLNKVIEKWKYMNKLDSVRFMLDDEEEDEDGLWF